MPHPAAVVFLPGILMPAAVRYAPLRAELGDARRTLTKELEIYASSDPPEGYSIRTEVDGLDRFASHHGLEKFHLYGHSAGGAVGLAYVTEHADRVLSLALDEPASDFTDEDRQAIAAGLPQDLDALPPPERMAQFAQSLVRVGVQLPPPPPPSDDPEMAKRPAGLIAFRDALVEHTIDREAVRAFDGPVYYSYGTLSNERWETMANKLEQEFRRCTVERYDGLHHLNTSHHADPPRVAAALKRLWADAEAVRGDR